MRVRVTLCMPDAHRGQKRVSHALEEQLQMFVDDHASAGNWDPGPLQEQQEVFTSEPALSTPTVVCTPYYGKICLEQAVEACRYHTKLVCDLRGLLVPNTKRTFPAAGKYTVFGSFVCRVRSVGFCSQLIYPPTGIASCLSGCKAILRKSSGCPHSSGQR